MPRGVDDPVLRFMQLMWSVDHGLHKTSKRMASTLGITGPQRLAVRMIGQAPGMTAGELSSKLHLDPSTVTGILSRLEDGGLIVRRVDAADARRSRLALTKRGRDVDRRSAGTIEAAVRRALASLTAAELDATTRALDALARVLDGGSVRSAQRRPRR